MSARSSIGKLEAIAAITIIFLMLVMTAGSAAAATSKTTIFEATKTEKATYDVYLSAPVSDLSDVCVKDYSSNKLFRHVDVGASVSSITTGIHGVPEATLIEKITVAVNDSTPYNFTIKSGSEEIWKSPVGLVGTHEFDVNEYVKNTDEVVIELSTAINVVYVEIEGIHEDFRYQDETGAVHLIVPPAWDDDGKTRVESWVKFGIKMKITPRVTVEAPDLNKILEAGKTHELEYELLVECSTSDPYEEISEIWKLIHVVAKETPVKTTYKVEEDSEGNLVRKIKIEVPALTEESYNIQANSQLKFDDANVIREYTNLRYATETLTGLQALTDDSGGLIGFNFTENAPATASWWAEWQSISEDSDICPTPLCSPDPLDPSPTIANPRLLEGDVLQMIDAAYINSSNFKHGEYKGFYDWFDHNNTIKAAYARILDAKDDSVITEIDGTSNDKEVFKISLADKVNDESLIKLQVFSIPKAGYDIYMNEWELTYYKSLKLTGFGLVKATQESRSLADEDEVCKLIGTVKVYKRPIGEKDFRLIDAMTCTELFSEPKQWTAGEYKLEISGGIVIGDWWIRSGRYKYDQWGGILIEKKTIELEDKNVTVYRFDLGGPHDEEASYAIESAVLDDLSVISPKILKVVVEPVGDVVYYEEGKLRVSREYATYLISDQGGELLSLQAHGFNANDEVIWTEKDLDVKQYGDYKAIEVAWGEEYPGEGAWMQINILFAARITVSVTDEEGNPVSGVKVVAEVSGVDVPELVYQSRTDSNGVAVLEVEPGWDYIVSVRVGDEIKSKQLYVDDDVSVKFTVSAEAAEEGGGGEAPLMPEVDWAQILTLVVIIILVVAVVALAASKVYVVSRK